MFLLRIIRMALAGLQANLLRSLLATLGVIIGVAAVVSAMSILEGAQKDILSKFESLGADQIIITNGTSDRQARNTPTLPSLTLDDVDLLARECDKWLAAVSPQIQRLGTVKYFTQSVSCDLLGTNESYASMNNYRPVEGNFLSVEDVRGFKFVCVLGSRVKEDLFGALPALGKQIRGINNKNFTVIGVMEERGVLGWVEVDKMVLIPVTTMQRLVGSRFLQMIVVQAKDSSFLTGAIDAVTKTLRRSHNIRAGTPDDFRVLTQEQAKRLLRDVTLIFAIVLYSIAGISLLVGGIGIMNIMTVSVTERTREIGVRIAVGARPFDIWSQFLIEAGVISFLGGVLGVLAGYAFSDMLTNVTGNTLKTYTPPWSILWALIMATGVGVISGLYPAIRAARLDPVEALRYE